MKNDTKCTNPESAVYSLPSIIFNNTKSFKLYPILFFGLCFFLIIRFSKQDNFFVIYSVSFFILLVLAFLITPRKLTLNEDGMQHHVFWRIKWSNFKNYDLEKNVLIIKTLDNKQFIVKGVKNENAKGIVGFLNKKLYDTV